VNVALQKINADQKEMMTSLISVIGKEQKSLYEGSQNSSQAIVLPPVVETSLIQEPILRNEPMQKLTQMNAQEQATELTEYIKHYPELRQLMGKEEYERFVLRKAKHRKRRAQREMEKHNSCD
jgi:hypothetical protein